MIFLLWTLACTKAEPVECSEELPCSLGAVCVEGKCETSSCVTSEQCGIDQYCDRGGTCTSGCQVDGDCVYGDYCDLENKVCAPAECTDTNIDCGFQEFCSPAGECYTAAGYYCRDCEEDGDCGGGGNLCYGGYCAVTCTSRADCPSGFDCLGFTDSLTGNIIGYGCYAACWLHE